MQTYHTTQVAVSAYTEIARRLHRGTKNSMKAINIRDSDKALLETLRMFGSRNIKKDNWRIYERLEEAGKVDLSEAFGRQMEWKTVKLRVTE